MALQSEHLIMLICSILSIIGDSYIILTFAIIKDLKNKMYTKIVFCIAAADFLACIGTVIGPQKRGTYGCAYQVIVSRTFELSCVLWTAVLTNLLYRVIFYRRAFPLTLLSPQASLVWFTPFILILLPLSTNTYGPIDRNEGWCFYSMKADSPKYGSFLWVILSFYGWVWACNIFTVVSFVHIFMKSNSLLAETAGSRIVAPILSSLFDKCWVYPFISMVCWCLPTYSDIAAAFNEYKSGASSANRTLGNGTESYNSIELVSLATPLLHGVLTTFAFVWYNREMLQKEWSHIFRYSSWSLSGRKVAVVDKNMSTFFPPGFFSKQNVRERADDAQVIYDPFDSIELADISFSHKNSVESKGGGAGGEEEGLSALAYGMSGLLVAAGVGNGSTLTSSPKQRDTIQKPS